jgi:hypothetical protein
MLLRVRSYAFEESELCFKCLKAILLGDGTALFCGVNMFQKYYVLCLTTAVYVNMRDV